MRNPLLASTLVLGVALAAPAMAQNTTVRSVPNGQNSGIAMPDPGTTYGSVPNGRNSGVAMPTGGGNEYRSVPNGRNSGTAMPTGAPATMTPVPASGARPGKVIGTGMSEPTSTRASNIEGADTRSTIAPRLPMPSVAADASPQQLLVAAQQALRQHRTGAALEALERAETRLLDSSSTASGAVMPSDNPMVKQVSGARMALGRRDMAGANQMIAEALATR